MILLGLHFGHDAAVSIVKDGNVLRCVERERLNRIKHAISLAPDDILLCLKDVGLDVSDVDLAAVTTTQNVEYIFLDRERLALEWTPHPGLTLPCTVTDRLAGTPAEMKGRMIGNLLRNTKDGTFTYYSELLPDWRKYADDPSSSLGDLQHFVHLGLWDKARTLAEIRDADYRPLLADSALRHGFHYPATLRLCGREIPAFVVAHHIAHIAYSYYESPFDRAGILSTDGGGGQYGYLGGMFAYGEGGRIFPWSPCHLHVGPLYDAVAVALGFDLTGGAGKLMGLSAYGKPRFFRREFVGNWHDLPAERRKPKSWINHCVRLAREAGYDVSALGDRSRVLEPVCVDLAASTQRLVEEILLSAAHTLHDSLARNGKRVSNLCLSGGVALNCPANTRLLREGPFTDVSVPPAVMDSGLAIGSALWLYHNVLERPGEVRARRSPAQAYLGLAANSSPELIESSLRAREGKVRFETCDPAKRAAADLAADRLVGWFQGRSEIGPRALGHRSILAHPGRAANWPRVNSVKKREQWRPLAPAVLEQEAETYFGPGSSSSYYMLFNFAVRSDDLPAVTHVDGSARVQSVNAECGVFYDLLKEFHLLSGIPVVLNTSFNGPGQPIIETPAEALEFFLQNALDVLYVGNYRVEKATS